MKLLSNSNSKLKKDGIKSFGLPAGKTCPFAGECKAFCYAQKGCFRFGSVQKAQAARFEVTKQASFIPAISRELKPGSIVRIHDSGDFYSKSYLAKWVAIAEKHPDVIFYCYTKSVRYFVGLELPKNLRVIFSYGGKDDSMIDPENHFHARIFNSETELKAAGYVDGSKSDLIAAIGNNKKIGLVMH